MGEGLSKSGKRRHQRPDRQRQGDDVTAAAPVRPQGDGDAEGRVDGGKPYAGQETQLRVPKLKLRLDGLQEDEQDLPIDMIERVDQRQDRQDVTAGAQALVVMTARSPPGLTSCVRIQTEFRGKKGVSGRRYLRGR